MIWTKSILSLGLLGLLGFQIWKRKKQNKTKQKKKQSKTKNKTKQNKTKQKTKIQ